LSISGLRAEYAVKQLKNEKTARYQFHLQKLKKEHRRNKPINYCIEKISKDKKAI